MADCVSPCLAIGGGEAEYSWTESESFASNYFSNLTADFGAAIQSGEIDILRDYNEFPIDVSPFVRSGPTANRGPFKTSLETLSARFSGPGPRLAAGDVQLSTLVEQRTEEQDPSFTDQILFGTLEFVSYSPPSEQQVRTLYAEALVPIFSKANRINGIEELEVQLAIRYDDYETTIPDIAQLVLVPSREAPPPSVTNAKTEQSATSYTLAISYSPTDDLTVRASTATGFLPPELSDLGAPAVNQTVGLGDTFDPRRGGSGNNNAPVTILAGGNPDLDPEESVALSVGLIFAPTSLPGFRVSLDYTKIDKTDEVLAPSIEELLRFEDNFPGRIVRAPLTPEAESLGFTGGEVIEVNRSVVNSADSSVEAFDFQIGYKWETDNWGVFDLSSVVTHQTALETKLLPDSPTVNRVGYIDGPLDWRGNIGLTWANGPWTVGRYAQHYGSYNVYSASASPTEVADSSQRQGDSEIPSQTYHELLATVRLGDLNVFPDSKLLDGTELRIGLQNVFDEDPPTIASPSSRGSASFSAYGDPRLRRYSIQLRKSF